VWTLQEVAVARNPVFKVGCYECPAKCFYHLCLESVSRTAEVTPYRRALTATPADYRFLSIDMYWVVRQEYQGISRNPSYYQDTLLDLPGVCLHEMLRRHCACQATDPRDHIYSLLPAILEVFGTTWKGPTADYSKPVTEIFEEFSRYLVMNGAGLELLYLNTRSKSITPLPSWVPDFSAQTPQHFPERPEVLQMRRPSEVIGWRKIHLDTAKAAKNGELPLKGQQISSVRFLGGRFPLEEELSDPESEHHKRLLSKFFNEAKELCMQMVIAECREFSEAELEAYVDKQSATVVDLIVQKSIPKAGLRNDFAIFSTSSNQLAVSRGDVQQGDIIVLLVGGYCPYIMRPDGTRFKFIGPCIIHGLNETESPVREQDIGSLPTFILC